MARAKDLIGKRFGRLLVLELDPEPYLSPSGKTTRRWICRCDCGKTLSVLQSQLAGGQQSCGCLQREAAASGMRDLTGQRFGRWTVLKKAPLPKPDSTGARTGWLCRCDCGTERVVLSRSLSSGASRSCGCDTAEKAARRLQADNVTGRFDGTVVSQLRPERKLNRNNASGVRGVYWSSREGMWIAKIGVRGKSITLGRFRTVEDAAKARKAAEEEYYRPIIDAFDGQK